MSLASTRGEAARLISAFASAGGLSRNAATVKNALPHAVDALGAQQYIAALRNLGATIHLSDVKSKNLTSSDLPCLFLDRSSPIQLVLDIRGREWLVLTAGESNPVWIDRKDTRGTAVGLDPRQSATQNDAAEGFLKSLKGFRGILTSLLVASFFTNLVALAAPILVMVIYDRIIPSRSIDTVVAFSIAAGVVVLLDLSLRAVRAVAVAHMGSLIEKELGLALFQKLSRLPLANLEKSGVHEQIARLRQFESFRDLFSGSLFTTALDLPFVLIFIGVLFYLAPPVGFLLVGVVVIFLISSFVSLTIQQTLNTSSSAAKSAQQQLLYEASQNVTSIQRLGAENYWSDRFESATSAAALAARKAKRVQLIAQTFGQSLMMAAGAGAIAFGTVSALSGDVSIGALIALMTLVWRVLGPVQALYASVAQLKGFVSGLRQVRRVLSLEGELVREGNAIEAKTFSGKIDLLNLSHRFGPTQVPVLSGVSLSIKPGEVTIFCGPSGSGCSTLFNLLNRLYMPTSGAIYLDDVDYRQITVDDLRRSVTAEHHNSDFFHGTIRQNFELANPVVTTEQIRVVLKAMGLDGYIRTLPEGIETRMDEAFQSRMSKSLSRSLGLARCLLRDSSIYLFDDPCSGLDTTHEHNFLTCIATLKGQRTILMTSDRPSHWELADHLVYLERGKVIVSEPRATALPKIEALYQQAGTKR